MTKVRFCTTSLVRLFFLFLTACSDTGFDLKEDFASNGIKDQQVSSFAEVINTKGLPPAPVWQDKTEHIHGDSYLHPVIPPNRTTEDGRVALNGKSIGTNIEFFLNVPEKINNQFLNSNNGPRILASTTPYTISETNFLDFPDGSQPSHVTLCDPSRQFELSRAKNNPFACGSNQDMDCYDLKVITSNNNPNGGRALWQTSIRVSISNPKTPNARITNITRRGNPQKGPIYNSVNSLFEPMIAGVDKRLLVARVSNAQFSFPDNNGNLHKGNYDIVYARSTDNFEPCDIRGFTQLYPIAFAPYDNAIKNKYGFAKNEFRDPTGRKIDRFSDIGGTYPWIDKQANNFVMMGVNSKLYNWDSSEGVVKTRYETRCAVSGCLEPSTRNEISEIESGGSAIGYIMTGLWTNGKMVYMDNPINNLDYGLKGSNRAQKEVKLFNNGPKSGWVRLGFGRDTSNSIAAPGHGHNSSFFESYENLFNHLPNLRPRSPRDVVWYVSSGQRTHEFAFDDYMNRNVLINAPMNAALEWENNRLVHRDGYRSDQFDFGGEIKIQNAATSTYWNIPSHGFTNGNNHRIEPAALGGVHGKGYFLRNSHSINFSMSSQPQGLANKHWYYSFYMDPRLDDDETVRTLIGFPNGDRIQMKGRSSFRFYTTENGKSTQVDLNYVIPRNKWSHIGFSVSPNGRWIRIIIDGYHIRTYAKPDGLGPAFQLSESGRLAFGWGLYGWVDDFKVIQGNFNQEEFCNYAGGSLIALESTYKGQWKDRANRYPSWIHKKVEDSLKAAGDTRAFSGQRYACKVDYSSPDGANVNYIPKNTFSVRNHFLFPEGPLEHDQPRPASDQNQFCLNCHTQDGKQGLDIDALVRRSSTLQSGDRRRQPMQALRRYFGIIPANYFTNGNTLKTSNSGYQVDRYMHPSIE